MADLNQLKQKYQPVIHTIQSFSAEGASVGSVALDGDKLLLQASDPSRGGGQSRLGCDQEGRSRLFRSAPRDHDHRHHAVVHDPVRR